MKFKVKARISKNKQKAEQLLAEGRRWVCFTVPISTWELFVSDFCQDQKPSDVVNRMIAEKVAEIAF